ncbi:NUDIX hydrolase [Actinomadura sp. 6N118]|uniref:NUDIX hydrolase n=1 Tax=Actinomadura sp. 6N118 TaxID=3375151 RepID=UPI0037B538AD
MNRPETSALATPPFLGKQDRDRARHASGAGSVAVVVGPDGIVLHLRDDKPSIPNPGRWSLFGGAADPGEHPYTTIVRELREELGITPETCRPLWRLVDTDGDGRLLTVFEARTNVATDRLVLNEGQALGAFSLAEALELRLAEFCRRVLSDYSAVSTLYELRHVD